MSEALRHAAVSGARGRPVVWAPRLLGVLLLGGLVAGLDRGRIYAVIRDANLPLVGVAIVAVLPLILVKAVRWRGILRSQAVELGAGPAFLAYLGSLFVGFATPGRVGDFVKAVHVYRDCHVSSARAFSSVLADRLFDFCALVVVGGAALWAVTVRGTAVLALAGSALLVAVPLGLLLNDRTFGFLRRLPGFPGRAGDAVRRLLGSGSWLEDLRASLRELAWPRLLVATGWTAAAYAIFFGQCYLLALAVGIRVGFIPVSYAVALGSLVTLLPVSVSGLGTREAAMVAYLSALGVLPEAALGLSLLIFATFYVAGGLMGAVAWWLKPASLGGDGR